MSACWMSLSHRLSGKLGSVEQSSATKCLVTVWMAHSAVLPRCRPAGVSW